MTTFQKSALLWGSGAVLGLVVGLLTKQSAGKTLGATALGAMLVGAIGDKALENAGAKAEDQAILDRAALRRREGFGRATFRR